MKYASLQLHDGHTAKVLSTFSQAAAPPKISSTAFLSGRLVLEKLCLMTHEYGQVEHTKSELVSEDEERSGVWTCNNVPSRGQNHIFVARVYPLATALGSNGFSGQVNTKSSYRTAPLSFTPAPFLSAHFFSAATDHDPSHYCTMYVHILRPTIHGTFSLL